MCNPGNKHLRKTFWDFLIRNNQVSLFFGLFLGMLLLFEGSYTQCCQHMDLVLQSSIFSSKLTQSQYQQAVLIRIIASIKLVRSLLELFLKKNFAFEEVCI